MLRTRQTIRSLIALLLLFVAVFGSTPRKFLHDALADHADADYGFRKKGTTVAATTYNCGFDHQVAESPYTPAAALQVPVPVAGYPMPCSTCFFPEPAPGFVDRSGSRGPPATLHG